MNNVCGLAILGYCLGVAGCQSVPGGPSEPVATSGASALNQIAGQTSGAGVNEISQRPDSAQHMPSPVAKATTTQQVASQSDQTVNRSLIASSEAEKPLLPEPDPSVQDAQESLPAMARVAELLKQQSALSPDNVADRIRINVLEMMVLKGDKTAERELLLIAEGSDKDLAVTAKISRLRGLWRREQKNAQAQMSMVPDLEALAKSDPESDVIFESIRSMGQEDAADATVSFRLWRVIADCCTGDRAREWIARPKVGEELRFKGVTTDGKSIDLAQYRGKVVVLSFWATWCPACKEELPEVAKLYQQQKDHGMVLIGVLTEDTEESLTKFRLKNPYLDWPVIIRDRQELSHDYGLGSIPSKCVIGPDGLVVSTVGTISPKDLSAIVLPLLKQVQETPGK